MKRMMILLLAAAVAGLSLSVLRAESAVYPDGFRGWVHVSTTVLLPGTNPNLASEEGMHHISANQRAVEGYATGEFPEGSVIVYELRETRQMGGAILEGDRKRVDVMVKSSSRYKSTGGWGFERFWGTDQTNNAIQDSGAKCFACHAQAQAHGFVFSKLAKP